MGCVQSAPKSDSSSSSKSSAGNNLPPSLPGVLPSTLPPALNSSASTQPPVSASQVTLVVPKPVAAPANEEPEVDLTPASAISVEEALKRVHDFDVVAFLGSKLSSFAIENIEKAIGLGNGEWSHVGIVVSTHVMDIENGQPNTFYLLESNAMLGNGYAFDIERNSSINGVQIRPLADVLREPNRCTALLQLNKHPWYKQSQDTKHSIRRALTSFYKQVRHRGYDFNPFHLMKAADLQAARKLSHAAVMSACGEGDFKIIAETGATFYDAQSNNLASAIAIGEIEKLPEAVYCSQLVALTLQVVGVLPRTIKPNRISPMALVGFPQGSDEQLAANSFFQPPIYINRSA